MNNIMNNDFGLVSCLFPFFIYFFMFTNFFFFSLFLLKVLYMFMWGSKNLSLGVGLKSHILIIIRPRRRNHEREPRN